MAQESDAKADHYIKIMLASIEYDHFVNLMKTMKRLHGEWLDKKDLLEQEEEEGSRGRERKDSMASCESAESGASSQTESPMRRSGKDVAESKDDDFDGGLSGREAKESK